MVENNEENSSDSLIDIFNKTPWSTKIFLGASIALASFCFYGLSSDVAAQYTRKASEIIQKNVRSNPSPEVYIERDGVRYYSHVDGKSIDELVK